MSTAIPLLLKEIGKNPPSSIPSETLLSDALTDIILGIATHAQCAALLTCLHFTKLDHDAHVISAFAKTMRAHALRVNRADLGPNVPKDAFLLDIVGTGGDGWGTFNASTSAAIVAAGAGCYICKVVALSIKLTWRSMETSLLRPQQGQQIYLTPSALISHPSLRSIFAPSTTELGSYSSLLPPTTPEWHTSLPFERRSGFERYSIFSAPYVIPPISMHES